MQHFLLVATSVFLALLTCNPAQAGGEAGTGGGFHLGGYTSAAINLLPGGKAQAEVKDLSLFLSWDGNGRWRFFSEAEVENPLTWEEGSSLTARHAFFDVERLYADYTVSERLSVRAGRFLTPVGRWNLIHADPLVWTTYRPLVTEQLFPLNANGMMLYGAVPFSDKVLEYSVYAEAVRDMRRSQDETLYEGTRGVRLALSGGLDVGMSLMDFEAETSGHPHYRLVGLDFATARNGWEASGEVYQRFQLGSGDGGSGGYLQGVAPLGGRWFAVGRYESLHEPAESSTKRWLIGAAWRPDEKHVLKLEYVTGGKEFSESPPGFMASFAVLF